MSSLYRQKLVLRGLGLLELARKLLAINLQDKYWVLLETFEHVPDNRNMGCAGHFQVSS